MKNEGSNSNHRDRHFAIPMTVGVVHVAQDTMGPKKTEEALRESEERYRRMTNAVTDYIYTVYFKKGQPVGTVHSEACVGVMGYRPEEFSADHELWINMVYPEDREAVKRQISQCISGVNIEATEHRITHKDGSTRWVRSTLVPHFDSSGIITSYEGLIKDITERVRAEEEKLQLQDQLRQAQKMQAIGTLAGGIAHDFNNILGALIGYTVLAKDDIPEGTLSHQNLQEVLISANRAKELVKQILTFSRKAEAKFEPVQINTIVQEATKLLRSSLPTTIDFYQDINCNCTIMADETHIHQVLLNLGTNAAHAMAAKGGLLQISLSEVNIDSDIMTRDGNLQQGPYVKLSVKDDGCGMSNEIKERIFEPFFTTKEVGKGTGMGLAVVHGIIEHHNGVITVNSKPGEGATFEIFFPRIDAIEIRETGNSEIAFGHGEKILLVDDELSLVDMTTQMLTRIGYEVIGKTDSIEALEVFQEDPDKFDLVITDQTMPKMTGTELAKKLMNIRSDIPIVLYTGFSEKINEESAKAVGIKELIIKPINREDISRTIREILDKKGATV